MLCNRHCPVFYLVLYLCKLMLRGLLFTLGKYIVSLFREQNWTRWLKLTPGKIWTPLTGSSIVANHQR
jgi:hypothetical protein